MKDILKLDSCPVSGLKITTKPEWKYVAKDGSCALEIALIGDNIFYEVSIGVVDRKANKWYIKTANKIIADYFGDGKFYLAVDYTLLQNASLETRRNYIKWFISKLNKIELVTIFGMNSIMKVAINTARALSQQKEKMLITNSYEESIHAILQNQNKSANNNKPDIQNNNNPLNKPIEKERINEIIGYLGNMTWAGNLNQQIPVLPNNDPFAELFAAVAASQDDLREIEKDKNETLKKIAKSEVLLQESEKYFRTLIENSIDVISVIDKNGNIQFMSKSAEKIFGYTIEERKKKNVFALMLPEDRARLMRLMAENIENYEAIIDVEFRFHRKGGSLIYMEGTAQNMLNCPRVNGIVFNYRDVTERKKQEEKTQLFKTVSDKAMFGNAIIDLQGNVLYINDYFAKKHGYTANELIGKNISVFHNEKQLPIVGEINKKMIESGSYSLKEVWHVHKNGTEFPMLMSGVLHYDSEGNPAFFSASAIDITAQKKIKQEKQQREDYLSALNKISNLVFETSSNTELQSFVNIIGKAANASRTYIFKNHTNKNNELLLSQVAEYVDEGIKPKIDNPELQNINYNDWLPRWEKTLKKGDIINGSIGDFSENERCLLEPQGIISLVVIPIFVDKTFWGFLGFDNCVDNTDWNDNDIKYLKTATKKLENSLELVVNKKLLETERKRFKALSEVTYEAIFISEKGICIDANKAASNMFGYNNNELFGIFDTDIVADESKVLVKNNIMSGVEEPYEAIAQRKNGSKFHAEFQEKMYNYNGKQVRVTAVRDITIRKQTEQKIKEESNNFNKIFYHNSFGVSLIENGVFIDCNDALKRMLNAKDKNSIINTHPSILSPLMQPDGQTSLEKANKMIKTALEKGFNRFEWIHKKITGEEFPVEVSLTSIKKNGNDVLHCTWNDISIRKQKEKELITAKEKAEESNRLKTAFINNMSHEIRTPLNGINGFLELLQDPGLEDEYKQEYIDIIKKSSNRLIDTVTDIMEISKIEAGLLEVSEKEISVNEIFNEMYNFFSLNAKEKNLTLKQIPSLSDNEAKIFTDNQKLTGILTNLIKNAIKFTDSGSVTFGYHLKEDKLEFFVKDTGIGIPKNRQKPIFNRFEQADIEDTRVFEGSGLGLSIAKSYVEALGGKIWLNSKEGVGTEFMFTIPYKTSSQLPKANSQKPVNNRQKPVNNRQKPITNSLKSLTVLIAEDEKVNNQLFDAIFTNVFKQIIYVETGQQAIEECKNNPEIDLILMDVKMPDINGYTATREIRKFNKEVIIIAQTAFGLSGDKTKATEAGCNDYITKPIDKSKLFEMIKLYFKD